MNIKAKTALTTLTLNVILTLLKFVLFIFSGSLAVLAEAWHSFSDIATSFMVFLAVRREKDSKEGEPEQAPSAEGIRKITFEQWVSIGIGLFLFAVAVLLFRKFFLFTAVPVKSPLAAGLIFIGLSLGSYLVYRFESAVGRQEKSVGLISDGMHARTDMMASLLTGFSLILYALGIDIDKWVAGLIALVVFSFAIETIVNVVISIVRKESEVLFRYKSYTILAMLFSPKTLAWTGEYLDTHLHIKFFGRVFFKKALIGLLILAAVIPVLWWASTCSFKVQPSEQALVERFGRPVDPDHPLEPGLHFKAPWPIDKPVIVETNTIRAMNIGNKTVPNTFALLWTQRHGTEIPFISGDNNYFYPYLVLHYRIKNLYDFRYRHVDPEGLMEGIANQLAGKLFATRPFFEIAIQYRKGLARDMITRIQATLDELKVGIAIVDIAVKDIHPPVIIADSFEMVIASIQEKEMMINEALAYRNERLPETRGDAVRLEKDAEGYALDLPLRAEGDAGNFLSRIPENEEIKRLTQKRLYLSSMLEALRGRSKVVLDPRAGQPELWLNMKELLGAPGYDLDKAEF